MSAIKIKRVLQQVIGGTNQPIKLGGILEDGSDSVLTIENGGVRGVTKNTSVTLPSASWTGASAPYSKAVTVSGILSTDYPDFTVVTSGTYATDIARNDEWYKVYAWATSTDTITFYATSVPTVDIPLVVKVVR